MDVTKRPCKIMNTQLKIPSIVFMACIYTFYLSLQLYKLQISYFTTPIRELNYIDQELIHFKLYIQQKRTILCDITCILLKMVSKIETCNVFNCM